MMDIVELTQHPERLDRSTLYELRSLLALYPYYQTVRLLLLQNLYLLHDPTFDEELRRAAIYITDRRVLFQMIEAVHYRHPTSSTPSRRRMKPKKRRKHRGASPLLPMQQSTMSLICSKPKAMSKAMPVHLR